MKKIVLVLLLSVFSISNSWGNSPLVNISLNEYEPFVPNYINCHVIEKPSKKFKIDVDFYRAGPYNGPGKAYVVVPGKKVSAHGGWSAKVINEMSRLAGFTIFYFIGSTKGQGQVKDLRIKLTLNSVHGFGDAYYLGKKYPLVCNQIGM